VARDPFRNDALRRALEQVESPLQKALRQMENDPATRALRELEESPAFRAARMLEQTESPVQRLAKEMQNDPVRQTIEQLEQSSALRATEALRGTDFQRLATSLVEAQSAFAAYTNSQHWAETSAAIAAVHSAITRPETVDVVRRIDADLKGIVTAAHHAVIPLAEQLQSFSVAAAAAVQPLQERFQKMDAWQTSLAERMAQLQNPWAIEDHLGVSMVGFARVARLLYYNDFMDLADIICQRHNWNDAFQRFFQSKPDFQASMQRLAPVRNTIGHNRPLVRADQITLLAEGYRILNALGVRMWLREYSANLYPA